MEIAHLPLLIEIFTEELPALPLLKEVPHIVEKWQKIAQKNGINSAPKLYFTPRRIILYDAHFPTKSKDDFIESYGPPLNIAFINGDKSQGLSKAGESFYKKHHLSFDIPVQTKTKDGKEVLYYAFTKAGEPTCTMLGAMVTEWLQSLHFGKSMFWGEVKQSFIRPIRNICVILGEKHISFNAFGLDSKAQTFVHRDVSFEPLALSSAQDIFLTLKNGKVILDQDERRKCILEQITHIESTHHIKVECDEDLLDEIVAITEYPQAAYGSFDEGFLTLPNEVIITSMKSHQRYFATYKSDGTLNNGFVLVANTTNHVLLPIIAGNQKVLKARLSDAMFFYENDIKDGFKPQELSQILFVEGLGSMLEKSQREIIIAQKLIESYAQKLDIPLDKAHTIVKNALFYAKADLLTQMVYEFPELQGVMGYYYAQKFGFEPLVALCIKEQYLPIGEDSMLPSHIISAIVALSVKLDNIFSLFSIGKIPSGSKDPFALRRAANGVLKLIKHFELDFELERDISALYAAVGYKASDTELISAFLLERVLGVLKVNPSLITCALNARINGKPLRNLYLIMSHIEGLNTFFEQSDKEALLRIFKRVANILQDDNSSYHIDEHLFNTAEEKALFMALKALKNRHFADTNAHIAALFALKEPLEQFFDNVLVNDDNPKIKANRQSLIASIYNEFLCIGDIKDITL